jgi:hypothetical protein
MIRGLRLRLSLQLGVCLCPFRAHLDVSSSRSHLSSESLD